MFTLYLVSNFTIKKFLNETLFQVCEKFCLSLCYNLCCYSYSTTKVQSGQFLAYRRLQHIVSFKCPLGLYNLQGTSKKNLNNYLSLSERQQVTATMLLKFERTDTPAVQKWALKQYKVYQRQKTETNEQSKKISLETKFK